MVKRGSRRNTSKQDRSNDEGIDEKGSYAIISKYVMADPTLSCQSRHLYSILRRYGRVENIEGEKFLVAWPGRDLLAYLMGKSVATITRYMQELAKKGLIFRRRRYSTVSTTHMCNPRYIYRPDAFEKVDLQACADAHNRRYAPRGVFSDDQIDSYNREAAACETSLSPSSASETPQNFGSSMRPRRLMDASCGRIDEPCGRIDEPCVPLGIPPETPKTDSYSQTADNEEYLYEEALDRQEYIAIQSEEGRAAHAALARAQTENSKSGTSIEENTQERVAEIEVEKEEIERRKENSRQSGSIDSPLRTSCAGEERPTEPDHIRTEVASTSEKTAQKSETAMPDRPSEVPSPASEQPAASEARENSPSRPPVPPAVRAPSNQLDAGQTRTADNSDKAGSPAQCSEAISEAEPAQAQNATKIFQPIIDRFDRSRYDVKGVLKHTQKELTTKTPTKVGIPLDDLAGDDQDVISPKQVWNEFHKQLTEKFSGYVPPGQASNREIAQCKTLLAEYRPRDIVGLFQLIAGRWGAIRETWPHVARTSCPTFHIAFTLRRDLITIFQLGKSITTSGDRYDEVAAKRKKAPAFGWGDK